MEASGVHIEDGHHHDKSASQKQCFDEMIKVNRYIKEVRS